MSVCNDLHCDYVYKIIAPADAVDLTRLKGAIFRKQLAKQLVLIPIEIFWDNNVVEVCTRQDDWKCLRTDFFIETKRPVWRCDGRDPQTIHDGGGFRSWIQKSDEAYKEWQGKELVPMLEAHVQGIRSPYISTSKFKYFPIR